MANKSSKSPSGEEREQRSDYMRDQEPDHKEVEANGDDSVPTMSPKKQENTDHKGWQEDHPQNPVRTGPNPTPPRK